MSRQYRTEKEKQMDIRPIPVLLAATGIPLMLSLLMNSLYNVVDSIFVSHLSEEALTALSLAAPVQMLMSALGCGIAVGLNAAISKAFGERDEERVKHTATAAMFLGVCGALLIMVAGIVGVKPYFRWQAGGHAAIYEYGVSYLRICMLFPLGLMAQWVFDRFLIATGRSSLFLITLSTASIVNLILDPILIFGYFGFPRMETAGAAAATVCGQFCGAIAGVLINAYRNREIPLQFSLRLKKDCMVNILKVGIPTAIMQGVVAFNGIFMNTILQGFSSTAVAVMGVCNRIQGLATIAPHGINNGLIPIVAYNYGARNRERVKSSIRWAMLYSHILMGIILIVLELFPNQILTLFDASDTMYAIGVPAIRILAISYMLSVFSLVCSTVFQALGLGNYSMYLTLFRQVFLPVGLAYLFSKTGQINRVWMAFVLAEVLAVPLAIFLMNKTKKRIIDII